MEWLLILTLGVADRPSVQVPVGLMRDEQTCNVAGIGMTAALETSNPGLDVAWTCLPADQGAGV